MQQELCALEVSISMQQTALDTQKNSMSVSMHEMQQEINSQLEESELLASTIATQRIALQEAKIEVETGKKLALQQELCALEVSIGTQQNALDTQKNSMSTRMHDMQQEISSQLGGHVSGYIYMVGQENNSTKTYSFIYGRTRFVP